MDCNKFLTTLKLSIFAGAMIGIAGFVNLVVGGVVGAFLFSFGLISIYRFKLSLFTGLAGRATVDTSGFGNLLLVLVGNIIGGAIVALLARLSPLHLQDAAEKIFAARLNLHWWKAGLLAIACGWIVEAAVFSWRDNGSIIPTLIGIPVFVLCGFPHCIADAFYYALVPLDVMGQNFAPMLGVYAAIVVGNYVGCNLRRGFKLQG